VVADWSTGRMCSVALDLPPGNRGVPTPAGAGDVFFSSWVFLREAGKRIGVRRGREIDAVLGASYAVADRLGVVGAEFRVREESGLRQRASAVAAF